MSISDHPRLLTVAEAAEKLAVSPLTVRRRIANGQVPAVQLGGKGSPIRIDERELDLFVYGWREP